MCPVQPARKLDLPGVYVESVMLYMYVQVRGLRIQPAAIEIAVRGVALYERLSRLEWAYHPS